MRIKFESNDNLPIGNIVNMHQVTINIRSVFAQNGNFYPQLFLDDALYATMSKNEYFRKNWCK